MARDISLAPYSRISFRSTGWMGSENVPMPLDKGEEGSKEMRARGIEAEGHCDIV
jgi:hypothetical protein